MKLTYQFYALSYYNLGVTIVVATSYQLVAIIYIKHKHFAKTILSLRNLEILLLCNAFCNLFSNLS